MSSRKPCRPFRLAAMLIAVMLSACASSSPPIVPVTATSPQPNPLPASVLRIDPTVSQAWLREVESYLQEVDDLLSSATPK